MWNVMRSVVWILAMLLAMGSTTALATTIFREPLPPVLYDDFNVERMPEQVPWSQLETIRQQVESGRGLAFTDGWRRLLLADDGRYAELQNAADEGPEWGRVGRFQREGTRLSLQPTANTINLATLDAEQLAQYETFMVKYRAFQAAHASTAGESKSPAEAATDGVEAGTDSLPLEKYLLLTLPQGEVLVADGEDLIDSLNRWEPGESVHLYANWHRESAGDQAAQFDYTLEIANPRSLGLPDDLNRLLTSAAVTADLLDVLDTPKTLRWKAQQANLRVKLDRGEQQGVYVGMQFMGLPPDEDLRMTVVESHADEAIAEMQISRFSPDDEARLPTPGAHLTTRLPESMACQFDTTLAVAGKVLAVSPALADLKFDADGFAFATITLDVARSAGFLLDDEVKASRYVVGEGRVRAMDASTTTVLWRVHRYYPDMPVELPKPGEMIGTWLWFSEKMEAEREEKGLGDVLIDALDAF